jgi:hypothetical protein
MTSLHAQEDAPVNKEMLADRLKELRTLENKMMAFPEQEWTRERARAAQLKALIGDHARRETA